MSSALHGKSFAAIDIGSHTIRLLIAELKGDREVHPLHVDRRITRLARDFHNSKLLGEQAIGESLTALEEYAEFMRHHHVGSVACGATGVLRKAGNAGEFLKAVADRTAIVPRVLSEESEAYLSAKGVLSVLSDFRDTVLTFDLGGSSTEFLLVDSMSPEPIWGTSVFVGAATVTERHLPGNPPDRTRVLAASTCIGETLKPALEKIKDTAKKAHTPLRVVGTAGTVTTLAAMFLGMTRYDPYRINGLQLTSDWLFATISHLTKLSFEERGKIPGLEKGREDIILGGALIVSEILKGLHQASFTVTDSGLLEGLLLDLMERDQNLPPTLRAPFNWKI